MPVSKGFPSWLENGQGAVVFGTTPPKPSEPNSTESDPAPEPPQETPGSTPPRAKGLTDQTAADPLAVTPVPAPSEITEEASARTKENRIVQNTKPGAVIIAGVSMPVPPIHDASGHIDGEWLVKSMLENMRANDADPEGFDQWQSERNQHARPMKMDSPIPVPPPLSPDGSEMTPVKGEGVGGRKEVAAGENDNDPLAGVPLADLTDELPSSQAANGDGAGGENDRKGFVIDLNEIEEKAGKHWLSEIREEVKRKRREKKKSTAETKAAKMTELIPDSESAPDQAELTEDTPGLTENQPWCLAVQVGEGRWIEMEGVIAYVDGYCREIEFPGFMTRSGESRGLTATFHMVEKTWRDGDVDRANISQMVVVDGLLMTAETVAMGVELVRQKTAIMGKGKRTHGQGPSWLKDGQALIVFGAKPPLTRPEEGAAVGEKVDPLAGVPEADLLDEYLAQEARKAKMGPKIEATLEPMPATMGSPPPLLKELAEQKAADNSSTVTSQQSPVENTEKISQPAKKNRLIENTSERTIIITGVTIPKPKQQTGKEPPDQNEPEHDEHQDRNKAVNSLGIEVDLPARPERDDFETQDDFEEALSGWNHSVLPLLDLERHSKRSSSAPDQK